ncbi:MAG: arginine deiminase family protein [Eggerthella lenta]
MIFNIAGGAGLHRPAAYNFLQMLKRRNFELIPCASEDSKHGCNVQCIGNGKVVAIEKNKHINDKMRALGLDVIDVPLDQILHAGGGPHCLTQPIERP